MKIKRRKSRLPMLIGLACVAVLVWFLAPLFYPVYAWLHIDLEREAAAAGIPLEQLVWRQHLFRYQPRGEDDPLPWQLVVQRDEDTPAWMRDAQGRWLEDPQTLVRVDLVSDRSGRPPRILMISSQDAERYFRARSLRLPVGALDRSHPRQVVLLDGGSWHRIELRDGRLVSPQVLRGLRDGSWIEDDPLYDDGYRPPGQRADQD